MRHIARATTIAVMILGASFAPVVSAAAQDVDRIDLTGGGFVRGTILEHIPGDHVTIRLATGEVRTIAATDVERVSVETTTPTDESAANSRVAVSVTANRDDLTLHRVTGTVGRALEMERLCSIPCTTVMPSGHEVLGWSAGTSRPRALPGTTLIREGITLHLEYVDRSTHQAAGAFILLGGLGGAAGLITVGALERNDSGVAAGLITAGALLALSAIIVGSVLAGLRNQIELIVREDGIAF